MKVACTCGKILTKDLMHKKAWVRTVVQETYTTFDNLDGLPDDDLITVDEVHYNFPPYGFMIEEKCRVIMDYVYEGQKVYGIRHEPERLLVGKDSILPGVIPRMPPGYGCCDWSMGEYLKCECGKRVGEMYLDCYESGVIRFIPKSIVRTYK